MVTEPQVRFFLGANSPAGFYSLYDQLIDPAEAAGVYILKGGPGCGKSTLMRLVAAQAEERGLKVEYIPCSGDPDSLDAVIFPERKAAIVDGTAPHGWRTKPQNPAVTAPPAAAPAPAPGPRRAPAPAPAPPGRSPAGG